MFKCINNNFKTYKPKFLKNLKTTLYQITKKLLKCTQKTCIKKSKYVNLKCNEKYCQLSLLFHNVYFIVY